MNQTQPVLLSQSHLKGKHTLCGQIALRSLGANIIIHTVATFINILEDLFGDRHLILKTRSRTILTECQDKWIEQLKSEIGIL